ncbi:MAG: minor capsid protein [Nitrospirales bacterium]|nr:minor capsid protein [Nitrospirales bacterium]
MLSLPAILMRILDFADRGSPIRDIRTQYPEGQRERQGQGARGQGPDVGAYGRTPLQRARGTGERPFAPTPDLAYAIGLPPAEAIKYFESKGYAFSWDWQDTWQEAHAKAFTVAKALRMDVLEDIRGMVQKALDEGITLQQFRKELEPKLQAKGWWGRKMIGDGTGATEVQLGSPRRLQTIYQTNLQTAYMAGRYKEMLENVDNQPYWQYVAVMDARTRPAHAALNGKAFTWDDPFWNTHYPPLGFNCRCRVRAFSGKDIQKRGLTVESSEGRMSWEDRVISKKTGEIRQVAVYHDPLTGERIATDPGWSYNPGKAWLDPFTPRSFDPSGLEGGYKTVGAQFPPKTPVEKLPAKTLTKDMLLQPHQESGWTEEQYVNSFLSEFGAKIGEPMVYRDVIGDPMVISDELFKDRLKGGYKIVKADREIYLTLLADTIKDPVEIWLTWVQGKDRVRLCKRYIGLYRDSRGEVGGYAVFDLIDDVWQGTTAFKPDKLDYLDSQRVGTLLYTKK